MWQGGSLRGEVGDAILWLRVECLSYYSHLQPSIPMETKDGKTSLFDTANHKVCYYKTIVRQGASPSPTRQTCCRGQGVHASYTQA